MLPPGFHRIRCYGFLGNRPATEARRVPAVAVRAAAITARAGRGSGGDGAERLGDGPEEEAVETTALFWMAIWATAGGTVKTNVEVLGGQQVRCRSTPAARASD